MKDEGGISREFNGGRMKNKDTATTAGLLAFGGGIVGAHQLYLKRKKNFAYIHIALTAVGMVLALIAAIIDMATAGSIIKNLQTAPLRSILSMLGYMMIAGSAIWGVVDGVIILMEGEKGLRILGLADANAGTGSGAGAGSGSGAGSSSDSSAGADAKVGAETSVNAGAIASSDAGVNGVIASSDVDNKANGDTIDANAKKDKKPMDPAVKKKIVLGAGIGGGALVVIGVIIAVIAIVTHVNYHETYEVAKQLKVYIYDIQKDTNCENVQSYASSEKVSDKTYGEYIYNCRQVLTKDSGLVDELGATSAIRKDKSLAKQYNVFKAEYEATIPTAEVADAKLELYNTWHTFVNERGKLTISQSSEKDYQAVANLLIESGNDELRKFGERWLELALAYRTAYKDYWGNSAATEKESAAMAAAKNEFYKYEENSLPDIDEIAGLDLSGIAKMHSEFRKLYDQIRIAYQDNYDGSGECRETTFGVSCS